MNKKNIALIIAASIALGSLGLSGYLYQQLALTQSELAAVQANSAALQDDMLALTSQIQALNATVTEYENEKAAALELEQKEKAERAYLAEKIADELIKIKNEFGDASLEYYLKEADKYFEGGGSALRKGYMTSLDFYKLYAQIAGGIFDMEEYAEHAEQIVEISEERKAELEAEVATEIAILAAEKEAEKARLEQLEREKAQLEEAKQQAASGAPKYGSLYTDEELAEMGTVDDIYAGSIADNYVDPNGTPIVGFN